MKKLIAIIFIIYSFVSFAQIPSGYYDSANGLEGYTLKTALHNIIKGHDSHSYNYLYTAYQTTDVDNYYENDGTVLDMYSENPNGADPYNWTHNNDHCGNYSDEGDCWNREHLFPQGFFGSSSPMVSDVHFVVPSDGKVNGMRNNYPFGNVASASWTSLNGSKKGNSAAGYSGIVFEPIDEFKGDIARMMLYFVTRYEGQLSGFNPGNSNNPLDGSENRGYEQWEIDVFLAWHNQDPVSQREIDRNNACYAIQNNRNPFIDHPEYVQCIWGGGCSGLNFTSTPVTSAMATQTYTYNITYNVDAETETLTCTKPNWLTFTANTANNTATLSGTPSASDVGNHNVELTLTENGETETQSFIIVVLPYSVIQDILDVDFSSCPPANWETVSVESNKNWECDTETYSINGYDGDVASNDWFISPELNLNDYENENLTFKTWLKYSDDGVTDPEVKLKYSTNYTGNGNPNSATWTTLSYNYPSSSQQETWKQSGDVDLSSINAPSVHIAFHYTSSGTNAGSAALWKIDDIFLQGDVVGSVYYLNSGIKIYPNPAKTNVNINSINEIKTINLFNILGKKCLNVKNINNKEYQLNLISLTEGVYFIEIKDINNNTILKKLIVE